MEHSPSPEDLFFVNSSSTSDDSASEPAADNASPLARPQHVPEKFWDNDVGALRVDVLLKSYAELERKLGSPRFENPPAASEDYEISCANPLLTSDSEVNTRLQKAGFSREQAQLVYDLASEKLMPLVSEIAALFEAENQVSRLIDHFGSEKKWREVSRQISTWAKTHLPPQAYEALSTTSEGVLAMHQMMSSGEPRLVRGSDSETSSMSDTQLRKMMRDPRYWRDQDASYIEKVREGFRRLYPE